MTADGWSPEHQVPSVDVDEQQPGYFQTFESINHQPSTPATSLLKNCQNRNFAPHESDCNKFYICQHGTFLEQR